MGHPSPREIAFRCLQRIHRSKSYSNIVLHSALFRNPHVTGPDRGFLYELVLGTLRWQKTLDFLIQVHCKSGSEKISPPVRTLLRMGIYQLLFMDRVPPHAALDETVRLTKRHGGIGLAPFVNGLMRNVDRNRGEFSVGEREFDSPLLREKIRDVVPQLAVAFSHPEWMVRRYLNSFGKEKTLEILRGNNAVAPAAFRINTLRCDPDDFPRRLSLWLDKENGEALLRKKEGSPVSVHRVPGLPEAVVVKPGIALYDSPFVRNGEVYPQDLSTILGVACSKAEPRTDVLDLCSGHGGKATLFSQYGGKGVRVFSVDRSEKKLGELRKNREKYGTVSVFPVCADIPAGLPLNRPFGLVFLDAPCSGLGTLRRHPEAKWIKEEEIVSRMEKIQDGLLQAASRATQPGGRLVYSVCSFEPEETTESVRRFLVQNPEFRIEAPSGVPKELEHLITSEGYLRVFPDQHGMDGYFLARLLKT